MNEQMNPGMITAGMNGSTCIARLFLYSPRNYGMSVLRPYMYGFNEDATNLILGAGATLEGVLENQRVANSREVAELIRPESNGIGIDMTYYSSCWTFVLAIYNSTDYASKVFSAPGGTVTILTGHCEDEPITQASIWDPNHHVTNPLCKLIVHSREILNSSQMATPLGMHSSLDVMCAEDIVSPGMNLTANNHDLYRMTPYDVLQNYSIIGGQTCSLEAQCALVNSKKNVPIQMALKTPGTHLRQIFQGLDSQAALTRRNELTPHGIGDLGVLGGAFDVDAFKNGVARLFSNTEGSANIQTGGLDVGGVITIGEIERIYPACQVHVTKFDNPNPQLDIIPQTVMDPQVTYSSMISSSVQAIAADCGLSSIGFQYQYYDPRRANDLEKYGWQVISEYTMLAAPPLNPGDYNNMLVAAVEKFRMRFHSDVAPWIAGTNGNFFVQVTHSNNGETQVHLEFLDNNMSNRLQGWYEAPNRLAGTTTTSVGTSGHFQANGQSLNSFVLEMQGKTELGPTGQTAFQMPVQTPGQEFVAV